MMRESDLEPVCSGQMIYFRDFFFSSLKETLPVQHSSWQCLSLPNTSSENLRYGQRGDGAAISTTKCLQDGNQPERGARKVRSTNLGKLDGGRTSVRQRLV